MKKGTKFLMLFTGSFLCLGLIGCVSVPKGFLKPAEGYLEKRQLQMRQYDTTDEKKIIMSVSGVLQDLGFTLSESETEIGLVSAYKSSDAKNAAQITGAVLLDVLCAITGSHPSATAACDKVQQVKASVVVKPSADSSKTVVRVTFQRIVWNMNNQISRVETVNQQEIYNKFYDTLSKAIFLEAQKI